MRCGAIHAYVNSDKSTHVDKDVNSDKSTHVDKDVNSDKPTHVDKDVNSDKPTHVGAPYLPAFFAGRCGPRSPCLTDHPSHDLHQ